MVTDESKPRGKKSRGTKGEATTRSRRKPNSLPPLPRTPKSPQLDISDSPRRRPQTSEEKEEHELRTLIGSPPPSRFLNKSANSDSDSVDLRHPRESWASGGSERLDTGNSYTRENNFLRDSYSLKGSIKEEDEEFDEEKIVYTPDLRSSYPTITVRHSPNSASLYDDDMQGNAIISANSASARSLSMAGSLVRSASSFRSNSSLSIPPKLVSYEADDGLTAVQEWVPESRISTGESRTSGISRSSSRDYRRRNSTSSSIRDLPSPLEGQSPLEYSPRSPKLKPLRK